MNLVSVLLIKGHAYLSRWHELHICYTVNNRRTVPDYQVDHKEASLPVQSGAMSIDDEVD